MNARARLAAALGPEGIIPELRTGHLEVLRMAVMIRMVAVTGLGVAMLTFHPGDRQVLVYLCAAAVFLAVPITWLVWRRFGSLPPWFLLRDSAVLPVFAIIQPSIRPLCMFAGLAVIVYTCITIRRPVALALTGVSAVGMIAATAAGHDGNWLSSAISYPLAAFAIALPATAIAGSLSRAWASNDEIIDQLGVVLFEMEKGTTTPTYLHGNTMALRGFAPERFLEPGHWEELLHPDDRAIDGILNEEILAGRPYRVRYRQRHADGHYCWIDEMGRPILGPNGEVLGMRGITMEVSGQVANETMLARLNALVEALPVPVSVLRLEDADDLSSLTYVYANPAAIAMSGDGSPIGRRLSEMLPAAFETDEHRGVGRKIARVALTGEPLTIRDAHLMGPGGRQLTLSLHAAPLPDRHVTLTIEDLTDLYAAQAELERRVYQDDLTGLAKRVKMREDLAHAPVGSLVVVLDLNQFKEINDAFGHDCGDELLIEVSRLLAEAPAGITVARFGGDEFGFYCPPGSISPEEVGRRVTEALSRPVVLPSGLTLQTSASIGITIKTREDTSADELLRQADVAMYAAKRAHSSFEVYDPADDTSAPHRMMLLGEVRRAIRNHELELHYQPIVNCISGDIVRLEGLIRWRHPTLGLLPPADFVELTEMSNLNTDVVLHTLETAIEDLQRWIDAGHPTPLSINVAGTTLHDARLMDSIIGRISRTKFPRHLLGIELAERQLLLGRGQSLRSLERLAAAGVWLSIDDFGTGTSSLAALRHIPAHELKIDKSFVDDLRSGNSSLIGSIVAMSHQLGLSVVAEGVEDEVTWRWLRAHGADHAQGYFFARPAPAAAIDELLASGDVPWRFGRLTRSERAADPAG